MKYTVPDYYNQFACAASACPATCCAGWQIVIDDRTLQKYRTCKTPFGNRLRNSIDWEQKTFLQYDGRCAFLDDENLCDIYTEEGPELFCRTCRTYPRHIEEFQNEREISLSLSCPVAAELILQHEAPVQFVTKETKRMEQEDEEFDLFLYSALQDCREAMIQIMQDRTHTAAFRMAKILTLGHDVQNRIRAGRLFEVQEVLERYQRVGADKKLESRFQKYAVHPGQCSRMKHLFELLEDLEVLDKTWPDLLAQQKKILYQNGQERCVLTKENERLAEQLMVYFLFTYFCGAVYDGDALAKVKMSVVCTLLLLEFVSVNPKNAAEYVWRFSRELEHSDPNLNQMEAWMNENSAAEFETLLYCILYGSGAE